MKSGPDWKWGEQDGGAGGQGVVTGFCSERTELLVAWQRTRTQSNYRCGACSDVRSVAADQAGPGVLALRRVVLATAEGGTGTVAVLAG